VVVYTIGAAGCPAVLAAGIGFSVAGCWLSVFLLSFRFFFFENVLRKEKQRKVI
jgi:hypothetical protein